MTTKVFKVNDSMNTVLPETECISEGENTKSIAVDNGSLDFISDGITNSELSDNIFRGFGSDRYSLTYRYTEYPIILTNTEILDYASGYPDFPWFINQITRLDRFSFVVSSITTNGTNQVDVFVAYSGGGYCYGGYADKIFIRHIDP